MERSRCRSCGAQVYFLRNPATDKTNPIDAVPVAGGNLFINLDEGTYRVMPKEQRLIKLYQSHFASCPNAAEHKK